jgi:RimJ/RimL family protein N-acetyltransferase
MNMVSFRVLQPGDEAALEAFLLPRIETSAFLLGNLREAGLEDHGQRFQGTYAAAFQNQQITGVVSLFWNGTLLLQTPQRWLGDLIHTAWQAAPRPPKNLLGPGDQVAAALQLLGISPEDRQFDESEVLYELSLHELVVPDALLSGQVLGRCARPDDLDLLTAWRVGYSIDAFDAADSPALWEDSRASMQRQLQQQRTWILETGGQPVAMSSFNAVLPELVQVGGVYTPPPLRRRGYGRAAVATSLLDARRGGVERSVLFTGEDNWPARRAYLSLGYRPIGDYRIVLLHKSLGELPR